MNVLLIKPPSSKITVPGDDFYVVEPLELEYVAAGVADKHDVTILDMRLDDSLEEHLEQCSPDIIGLTSYTHEVNIVRRIAKKIKIKMPTVKVVVGGLHATLCPQHFHDDNIDIVVRGEGVFTFAEIMEYMQGKKAISDIHGIAVNTNGKQKNTSLRPHPHLDSYPLPHRMLTEKYREKYFSGFPDEIYRPVATLITSKGCAYRCKFCTLWKFTEGRYLVREPENILEELHTIKSPHINFGCEEAFLDKNRVKKLAERIIESGIKKKFYTAVRSDTVIDNPDLIELWREAGLHRVVIGMESHRTKDLAYLRKNNSIENNEKAIRILNDCNIKVDATFIISPDYTIQDFDNLAQYVNNLNVQMSLFMPLTPFPGTDLYEELESQLTTKNMELFDLNHVVLPTTLPLHQFYRELSYLYLRINNLKSDQIHAEQMPKYMKLYKDLKASHLHHGMKEYSENNPVSCVRN